MIENGRFSLQLLEADVSHGGYWGGFAPKFDDLTLYGPAADVPKAVPDPCLVYDPVTWNPDYQSELIGIPMQVYEIPSTVPTPALSVCATASSTSVNVVASPKASTDVLLVRHADTSDPSTPGNLDSCIPGTGGCPAAGEVYFQRSNCTTETTPNVLSMSASAGAIAPFTLTARNCTTPEPVRKLVSNLYYVRSYASQVGDGVPTLMRSTFSNGRFQAADAMIEGVEGFRIELGVDNVSKSGATLTTADLNATAATVGTTPAGQATAIAWADLTLLKTATNRGDGNPDTYVRCTTAAPCSAFQLANVVSAKIYVLARSLDVSPGYKDTKTYQLGATTLGPFNDNYKRHLFTQVVRLTNVSMRRETPN